VPAADKAQNLATVDDREDDPVAESVDETAGAGDGGDSGSHHLLAGDTALPEMIDQSGRAGGGLSGLVTLIVDEIMAKTLREIGLTPRRFTGKINWVQMTSVLTTTTTSSTPRNGCVSPWPGSSQRGLAAAPWLPGQSGLPSTPTRAGYGGHTISMPIEDMLESPTWIAVATGDRPLSVQKAPA
jgi:hypothetical protein